MKAQEISFIRRVTLFGLQEDPFRLTDLDPEDYDTSLRTLQRWIKELVQARMLKRVGEDDRDGGAVLYALHPNYREQLGDYFGAKEGAAAPKKVEEKPTSRVLATLRELKRIHPCIQLGEYTVLANPLAHPDRNRAPEGPAPDFYLRFDTMLLMSPDVFHMWDTRDWRMRFTGGVKARWILHSFAVGKCRKCQKVRSRMDFEANGAVRTTQESFGVSHSVPEFLWWCKSCCDKAGRKVVLTLWENHRIAPLHEALEYSLVNDSVATANNCRKILEELAMETPQDDVTTASQ